VPLWQAVAWKHPPATPRNEERPVSTGPATRWWPGRSLIFMLFEFRRIQEMQASRLAARRASPSQLREIESAVRACRHGHVNGDNSEFNEGDDAFHLGVATASHNVFLVSAVRGARALQRQASVIGLHELGGHVAAAVEEHEAIYRAIRDGEPEATAEATSVHLDNALEDYRREIQRRVFG
jgi:GntR family transcriptional repressor for pyruvate dehydrogenase complex